MEENKISVHEYLDDAEKLEVTYIPFDDKLKIVSKIIRGIINSTGGLNSSLLRRISTEVFIESITNIDLSIEDEDNLSGFDQLCYHRELDKLIALLGDEYKEFKRILDEHVDDYVRIETNPAVTINAIYDQIMERIGSMLDYLSNQIQNVDIEELTTTLSQLGIINGGVGNESK